MLFVYIIVYGILIKVFIDKSNNYIDEKKWKLESKAEQDIENLFGKQDTYIDTYYSNNDIKYYKTNILDILLKDEELQTFWDSQIAPQKDYYLDCYSFFETDSINNGWELFVVKKWSPYNFITFNVYPAYVGYRIQTNSYLYNLMPSVQEAIENAYTHYPSDADYKKGSKRRIDNFISDFENEYFKLVRNENFYFSSYNVSTVITTKLFDDYVKVFMKGKNSTMYTITEKVDVINRDKKDLKIKRIIIISCIFIGVIVLHIFLFWHRKRINNM